MSNDYGQVPFAEKFDFAEDLVANPQPRVPVVLLLDTSGSMQGSPIAELNAGLVAFKEELISDSLASKRAEISVVTFGPVQVHNPFMTADIFQPPHLQASGDTPMGAAIVKVLELVEERKQQIKASGVQYYRPWIFMITDGGPTDSWQESARVLREAVEKKQVAFFAIAVEGADIPKLTQLSPRKPLHLKGLKFRELFEWLSNSLGAVSRSSPKQEVLALPPPSSEWSTL
jgi:uncharacterized protein YegL